MAKQRQSPVPAAVMHVAEPHWQVKCQATPRALLPAAESRAQAKLLVTAEDPPSPGLRRASWRPPLLEPQD